MMAVALIQTLESRGFCFVADGDKLIVSPSSQLTESDREVIKKEKQALLQILAPRPYLTGDGELRIPLNASAQYRWWQGGQSVWATLKELNAPLATWRRHAENREDLLSSRHEVWCGGEVEPAEGFVFCTECGSYAELPQESLEWVN